LGRSLGVDLTPFKTCTLDCVYCQLGVTTNKTLERREFVPMEKVIEEVQRKLAAGTAVDYVTMSGSGEPTLYSRLGELIDAIKSSTHIPVAVITNGTLLWQPDVRADLCNADVVVPSLDAGDAALFQRVNRPHPHLDIDVVIEGLVLFREEFSNQLWLEIFLLDGTTRADIARIAAHIPRIRPDRIHLNTVARPPAEAAAHPLSSAKLAEFAQLLGDKTEIVAEFAAADVQPAGPASPQDILDMVKRHPCSIEDIAKGLAIHRAEAVKHVEHLLKEGKIGPERRGKTEYYVATTN
jgi:wyosine [tRNA(Phe)-imidazoG37] synthetase (radical SAM superfamily)